MSSTTQPDSKARYARFISLRWRLLFPVMLVLLIAAMLGAYMVSRNLTADMDLTESNVLQQSSQAVTQRSVDLFVRLRNEAQRLTFTSGIAEGVALRDVEGLLTTLRGMAAAASLDSLILTDAAGEELAGVLRLSTGEYSVATGTSLADQALLERTLAGGRAGTSALLRTPESLVLYVALPIEADGQTLGMALAGMQLSTALDSLKASALADLVLFSPGGLPLASSFDESSGILQGFELDRAALTAALQLGQVTRSSVQLADATYRIMIAPFVFGETTLGVVATLIPDTIPFVSEMGRQMTGILAAALSAATLIAVFIGVTAMQSRLDRLNQAAGELAAGQRDTRTGLRPVDEIGRLGEAIDRFADASLAREDRFRRVLGRQRRELNYLLAVLEAMPEGVLVQDREGRLILMNSLARSYFGDQALAAGPDFRALGWLVEDVLGPVIAPGIYALGKPQQIEQAGRMLRAQAAALMTTTGQRLGTVVLLRDISEEVQREQSRDQLLSQLAYEIQEPLAGLAQTGAFNANPAVTGFAREISRHSAALQKMIVDMRELTAYSRHDAQEMQRPLAAETLIWALANDWRQIAQAANLNLQVMINVTGVFVLGDESRLRWALGNIVDNAIKYTPSGGSLTLEIKELKDQMLHFRVRDSGVGIREEDKPHLFMPFYRGTPTLPDGQVIRVPGMGQGLPLAQKMIQAHGGMMRVKSRPGEGTAVYIALPQTAAAPLNIPGLDAALLEGETVRLSFDVSSYDRSQDA